jgi:cytoskeletal protein CcmA (bactofilin family)
MFNKENADPKTRGTETIIGQSVKVKGNFHGEGNIVIEGSVEGSVKTKGFLEVGEKASITASVEAKDALIGGNVVGNIKIDGFLEVRSTAKIDGDIETGQLSVEKGAVMNGRCTMGKPMSAPLNA